MKTAIVTGGNRGIGFEICRQLDQLGWQVLLCTRNFSKGLDASAQLSHRIIVKQLDVTDENSVNNFMEHLDTKIGKVDVLINNAGVGANANENKLKLKTKQELRKNFNSIYQLVKKMKRRTNQQKGPENVVFEKVKETMETNFYGPWRMINVLLPLLLKAEEGKIINISSGMGAIENLNGEYPAYSLSKSSLNALTVMFANRLKDSGIKVNAVCPGWVNTEMGGPDAPRTVGEGAETPVWLATSDNISTGKFYRDKQIIEW